MLPFRCDNGMIWSPESESCIFVTNANTPEQQKISQEDVMEKKSRELFPGPSTTIITTTTPSTTTSIVLNKINNLSSMIKELIKFVEPINENLNSLQDLAQLESLKSSLDKLIDSRAEQITKNRILNVPVVNSMEHLASQHPTSLSAISTSTVTTILSASSSDSIEKNATKMNTVDPSKDCNRITISNSSMSALNGQYFKSDIKTKSDLSIFKRSDTRHTTLIIPFADAWCITMSFSMFSDSELTPTFISENCKNLECCLVVSDLTDDKTPITNTKRNWSLKIFQSKNKLDENIRLTSCALDSNVVAQSKSFSNQVKASMRKRLNVTTTDFAKTTPSMTTKENETLLVNSTTQLIDETSATKIIDCKVGNKNINI